MRRLSVSTTRDDAGPAAGAATGAGGGEPVAGLADDVAAAILGQGERQVEDEAAVGVLAGGDTVEDLDRNAAGEQLVEYEQAFEQVTAESVDLLHGEHVARAQVVDRGGEPGPGVDGELIFSSNIFTHSPSSASCCRAVSCLLVLTRTSPTNATTTALWFSKPVQQPMSSLQVGERVVERVHGVASLLAG